MMLAIALKSTIVLAAAWIACLILRRRSASMRHLVWTAAAAAVLLLPLLSLALPALHIRGAEVWLPSSPAFVADATASGTNTPSLPAARTPRAAIRSVIAAAPRNWRSWLTLLWAAGAGIGLLELLAAWAVMSGVRRAARPAFGDNFGSRLLCSALARDLGIGHRVDVLESAAGAMPVAFGLFRPAILLPDDFEDWTGERRRIVLLHELAHIRRADSASHLLVRAALAVYWWNPLAWLAWRESLKESERAADDLVLNVVLNQGARASDYAGHLLDVARSLQPAGWAAVAMARRSHLEARLAAILDSSIDRRRPARAWILGIAAAVVAVVAPLAAVRAQDDSSKAQIPADVDAAVRAATSQRNYQVLEDAAKAAEQAQKYDTAKQLLEPAAAIRADISGDRSVDYALGLIKLGELENRRNNAESAKDFYTRANQILGDNPAAAPALIYLGRTALGKKDFDQAADYFQRAENLDPAHAGHATFWLAITRQKEGNTDAAAELYQRSIALLGSSDEGVTARVVYARLLNFQKRDEEAKQLESQATDLRKALVAQARTRTVASPDAQKIGASITAPVPVFRPEPQYSNEARVGGIVGTEVLYLEIGPDGLARNIQVLSGPGFGLNEKGVDAVGHWQFKAATKDGQPVPVSATIEINWRLL